MTQGSGDSSGPDTYYFKIDNKDPAQAIIDAVTCVTGTDPIDLEPLHEVVSADALNTLMNGQMSDQISFEMAGAEVIVSGPNELVIEFPSQSQTLHDQLNGASSVLLLAPNTADEPCIKLLSAGMTERSNVLGVTFSRSAYELLQVLDTHLPTTPAQGTVISMGEFTRSTAASAGEDVPESPFSIETIKDPTDVVALGIQISEQLSTWADLNTQTVACIRSLTDLLTLVDHNTAHGFLDALTNQFESADVIAHYHMNSTAHADQTIGEFRSRFEAVIEVDESGGCDVQTD